MLSCKDQHQNRKGPKPFPLVTIFYTNYDCQNIMKVKSDLNLFHSSALSEGNPVNHCVQNSWIWGLRLIFLIWKHVGVHIRWPY